MTAKRSFSSQATTRQSLELDRVSLCGMDQGLNRSLFLSLIIRLRHHFAIPGTIPSAKDVSINKPDAYRKLCSYAWCVQLLQRWLFINKSSEKDFSELDCLLASIMN